MRQQPYSGAARNWAVMIHSCRRHISICTSETFHGAGRGSKRSSTHTHTPRQALHLAGPFDPRPQMRRRMPSIAVPGRRLGRADGWRKVGDLYGRSQLLVRSRCRATRAVVKLRNDDGASKKMAGNSQQGSVVEASISPASVLGTSGTTPRPTCNFGAQGRFSQLAAVPVCGGCSKRDVDESAHITVSSVAPRPRPG